MKTKELNTYWKEIEQYFQLEPKISNALLKRVLEAYTASDRQYHNEEHIRTLLMCIDGQRLTNEGRITLLLATFYHDVVYVPGSKRNEEKSAAMLKECFCEVSKGKELVEKATAIVLDTKHHETTDELSQLFLDMDLAILGAEPSRYRQYCEQIRKEFQNVPEFLYRKGRKRFVSERIRKQPIFQTKTFQKLYEMQARENLNNELLEL